MRVSEAFFHTFPPVESRWGIFCFIFPSQQIGGVLFLFSFTVFSFDLSRGDRWRTQKRNLCPEKPHPLVSPEQKSRLMINHSLIILFCFPDSSVLSH